MIDFISFDKARFLDKFISNFEKCRSKVKQEKASKKFSINYNVIFNFYSK
jgi:hypothetical protein